MLVWPSRRHEEVGRKYLDLDRLGLRGVRHCRQDARTGAGTDGQPRIDEGVGPRGLPWGPKGRPVPVVPLPQAPSPPRYHVTLHQGAESNPRRVPRAHPRRSSSFPPSAPMQRSSTGPRLQPDPKSPRFGPQRLWMVCAQPRSHASLKAAQALDILRVLRMKAGRRAAPQVRFHVEHKFRAWVTARVPSTTNLQRLSRSSGRAKSIPTRVPTRTPIAGLPSTSRTGPKASCQDPPISSPSSDPPVSATCNPNPCPKRPGPASSRSACDALRRRTRTSSSPSTTSAARISTAPAQPSGPTVTLSIR